MGFERLKAVKFLEGRGVCRSFDPLDSHFDGHLYIYIYIHVFFFFLSPFLD